MSSVTRSLSLFLGVFLQTFLVGLFVPLVIVAGYVQWKKVSKGQKINVVMAFTTAFFGLTIPIHWILGMRRVILASLYRPPGVTMDQYLQPPYSAEEITRWAIFQFSLVAGDLVMIYRMYHIYNKSILACVIPSITTAGLFVIGCGFTNQYRYLRTPKEFQAYSSWATASFCVTLFNSVFMSAAICHRLWRTHREAVTSGVNLKSDSLTLRAMRGLVESAALWTFLVSLDFFAFLAKSDFTYTFLDMTSPAIGISFCLIIVRLGSIAPEIREAEWESSERSRSSRFPSDSRPPRVPIPLESVKVEQDVYVSESESAIHFHMMSPMKSPPVR